MIQHRFSRWPDRIEERYTLSIFDIHELAKDIPRAFYYSQDRCLIPNNDFYGIETTIKRHLLLPADTRLRCSFEHGFSSSGHWPEDLAFGANAVCTFSRFRAEILEQVTSIPVYYIGPYIFYATGYMDSSETTSIRNRLGRILLYFPTHSTHYSTAHYDAKEEFRQVARFSTACGFDTILVCLYWKDIQLGRAKWYQYPGVELVTAGHIFDWHFLPRLRSIIEISDYTASSEVGTHVAYCHALQKGHIILDPLRVDWVSKGPDARQDISTEEQRAGEAIEARIRSIFSSYSEGRSSDELAFADFLFGLSESKGPQALRRLIASDTESVFP